MLGNDFKATAVGFMQMTSQSRDESRNSSPQSRVCKDSKQVHDKLSAGRNLLASVHCRVIFKLILWTVRRGAQIGALELILLISLFVSHGSISLHMARGFRVCIAELHLALGKRHGLLRGPWQLARVDQHAALASMLDVDLRTHTGQRLIACWQPGFSNAHPLRQQRRSTLSAQPAMQLAEDSDVHGQNRMTATKPRPCS